MKAWAAAEHGFHALAAVAGVRINVPGTVALTPRATRRIWNPPTSWPATSASREVDAWVLARCGIPLRLATLNEFTRRATQLNADTEAEAALRDARAVTRPASTARHATRDSLAVGARA